jgi:hypothetical protein
MGARRRDCGDAIAGINGVTLPLLKNWRNANEELHLDGELLALDPKL